jgi:hypothetical protein
MAEDPPYIPPGAEEGEESDVLGKLDHLLNKHKPRTRDPQAELVPVLTEALHGTAPDGIPTLTDIVEPGRTVVEQVPLESALLRSLALGLEAERARLAAESNGDPVRIAMLDELALRLRDALAGIVKRALRREP